LELALFSRRRFLQASSAAAGAGLATSVYGRAAEKDSPSLPAPIAALKSLKSEATPITAEERAARQQRARELMSANKLDAIILMEGTSLRYFTGIRWWGGERLFAMVLPRTGDALFVGPAFERDRALEQIAKSPDGSKAELRVWEEDENPYALVAQGLKDRGLATGNVGLEERVAFVFSDALAHAVPQVRFVSATPVTAGCRMIKSDHEIALMRLASKVTWTAYQAAYLSAKEGMTQTQFSDLIEAAHKQLGFEGGADVQVGEYTAFPHGSVAPQTITEGKIVMMDGGCSVEGYQSDITRTFVLGKPSDKMRQVFDIVLNAQTTAVKTAHPGLECQAVDAAARKIITDAGYGPDYKYFTHRVGHGIGMDGHEWPYLVRGDKLPLAANMTFSDEPGIYIRGEFGIRLEDDMHITESSAELFTPQSPSLEQPFAKA
jgi:Xaa-Pro dipeptidase